MSVVTRALQVQINGNPGTILPQEGQVGTQLAARKIAIRGNYRFSRDGGAISTITLKDIFGQAITLPAGLVIDNGLIITRVPVVSGGATTLNIGLAAGAQFASALPKTSVDGVNEVAAIIPVGSAASAVVVAAPALLTVVVAASAITAGEFDVFLEGFFRE